MQSATGAAGDKQKLKDQLQKAEDILKNTSGHKGGNMQAVDPFVESFWYWNKFSSYLLCIAAMNAALFLTTYIGQENKAYVAILGTMSSGVEALLGTP